MTMTSSSVAALPPCSRRRTRGRIRCLHRSPALFLLSVLAPLSLLLSSAEFGDASLWERRRRIHVPQYSIPAGLSGPSAMPSAEERQQQQQERQIHRRNLAEEGGDEGEGNEDGGAPPLPVDDEEKAKELAEKMKKKAQEEQGGQEGGDARADANEEDDEGEDGGEDDTDENEDDEHPTGGTEVCKPLGDCEACPSQSSSPDESSLQGCKETNRHRRYDCRTITLVSSEGEGGEGTRQKRIERKTVYKSCKRTDADEQFLMVRFQGMCVLFGILALMQVRMQKRRSQSLFDQRRAVGDVRGSYRPVETREEDLGNGRGMAAGGAVNGEIAGLVSSGGMTEGVAQSRGLDASGHSTGAMSGGSGGGGKSELEMV